MAKREVLRGVVLAVMAMAGLAIGLRVGLPEVDRVWTKAALGAVIFGVAFAALFIAARLRKARRERGDHR